jgi:hypothetical protein
MTNVAEPERIDLKKFGYPPEVEMLLHCARTQLEPAAVARVRALVTGSLNWDALYTNATRHGLLPLLHWHLSSVAADLTPDHVSREFRREFEENAARSFVLTTELLEILAELKIQGTRVATYKGPALAVSAYGNLLLRPFCDLDLLLRRRDLPLVRAALIRRGYAQQYHSNEERNEYAHSFVKRSGEGGGIVVEAHWSVTPYHYVLPPVPQGALERLQSLPLLGQRVLVLAPEDQLLVLCWHGYKHRWSRLEWVACIAEIVRRSKDAPGDRALDWERLWETARRAGSLRLLGLGLGLARELLDAPLPENINAAMRADRVLGRLLAPLQILLLTAPGDESSQWPALKLFHLSSRERGRDKARYCWRLALAPRQLDWQALRSAVLRDRRTSSNRPSTIGSANVKFNDMKLDDVKRDDQT